MSATVDILFLDSQTLGKPTSLQDFLGIFSRLGFQFTEFVVLDSVFTPEECLNENTGILDSAYQAQSISYSAVDISSGIEIYQQIAWGESQMGKQQRAYIRTSTNNTAGFWREGFDNESYCSLFLTLASQIYYTVVPTYGWVDLYHGWTTTHEEIESLKLSRLYWANFFGPKLVQAIGLGTILDAPAWKVLPLIDGGILYLLAPHLGLTDEHVDIEAVKAHFGVSFVR